MQIRDTPDELLMALQVTQLKQIVSASNGSRDRISVCRTKPETVSEGADIMHVT